MNPIAGSGWQSCFFLKIFWCKRTKKKKKLSLYFKTTRQNATLHLLAT